MAPHMRAMTWIASELEVFVLRLVIGYGSYQGAIVIVIDDTSRYKGKARRLWSLLGTPALETYPTLGISSAYARAERREPLT